MGYLRAHSKQRCHLNQLGCWHIHTSRGTKIRLHSSKGVATFLAQVWRVLLGQISLQASLNALWLSLWSTELTQRTITRALLRQPELQCPKFVQLPFWKVYLSISESSAARCIPHPLIPTKENHLSRYPNTHSCFRSWFVTVSTVSC